MSICTNHNNSLDYCPFCGSEVEIRDDGDIDDMPFWVNCTECPASMGCFYKKSDCVYYWNTRSDVDD